jgi:hypothetical protein
MWNAKVVAVQEEIEEDDDDMLLDSSTTTKGKQGKTDISWRRRSGLRFGLRFPAIYNISSFDQPQHVL